LVSLNRNLSKEIADIFDGDADSVALNFESSIL